MVLNVLRDAVLMCSLACGVLCVGLLVGVWGGSSGVVRDAGVYVVWE